MENPEVSFKVSIDKSTGIGTAIVSFEYRDESSQVSVSIDKLSPPIYMKSESLNRTNVLIEHTISSLSASATNYIKLFTQNILESIILLEPFYTHAILTCRIYLLSGTSIHSTLVSTINALSLALLNSGIPIRCSFFALLSIEFLDNLSHTTLFIVNQDGQLIGIDGPVLPSQSLLKHQLDCYILSKFRQALTQ